MRIEPRTSTYSISMNANVPGSIPNSGGFLDAIIYYVQYMALSKKISETTFPTNCGASF